MQIFDDILLLVDQYLSGRPLNVAASILGRVPFPFAEVENASQD